MITKVDTRQSKHRASLKSLGAQVDTQLDSIVEKVQTELDYPLRMSASFPTADAKLIFSDSQVATADGAKNSVPAVGSQVFSSLNGAFINFQTQALSNVLHFDISFPASTVGQFRRAVIALDATGKLKVVFSNEFVLEASLPDAGPLMPDGLPIGYIDLVCTNVLGYFKTAGSVTSIIENAKIVRFGVGGGGGGGSAKMTSDAVTGQTGTTITFAKIYKYNGDTFFFRNGVLMDKVNSFSGIPQSQEYMEVNNGLNSTQITLNSLSPATATDVFQFFHFQATFSGTDLANKQIATARVLADTTGAQNCTLAVVSNKSKITLSGMSYIYDQNSGNSQGDVQVRVNGQAIERKVVGVNDTVNNIIFEEDPSGNIIYVYKVIAGPSTQELFYDVPVEIQTVTYYVATTDALAGDLIPLTNNFYNLGNPSKLWKGLYYKTTKTTVDTISALDIDWASSTDFIKDISATNTFTFSNLPSAGQGQTIIVAITNTSGSAQIANFPAGIKWPGASAVVSVPANRTNVYTFKAMGTVIYAVAVEDMG